MKPWFLTLLVFLTACGSLEKGSGSSVAFDLPPALQTQSTTDTKAFLLATNSEETKELELTIAGGKVSGTINLKPGLWTLELHFYQKAPSGSYLLVAMVSFGEKEVGEEGLELSYDPSQIFFDDFNGTSPSIASPSVSLPENCSKLFDCDGDGFSNFEEIKAGSNPEDAKSMPQKKSESVSAPVATTTTINKSSVTVTTPPLTRVMDGLVGWWKFDEGTGYLAKDSSGNGNDGTLMPQTTESPGRLANGVSGEFLHFDGEGDGSQDYVLIGDKPTLEGMTQLTVEAWVRTNHPNQKNTAVISKDWSNNGSYVLRMNPSEANASDGMINFRTETDTGDVTERNADTESGQAINDGAWHHVVGTYDGATQKIFIDGILQSYVAQTGIIDTGDYDLCFATTCYTNGDGSRGFYRFFIGDLDEVAIYNRALTTAEVRNNCQVNDPTGSTCAADDVPDQITPSGVTLPPTRAFISWKRGTIPTGKTFDHDQLCYATNGSDISPPASCLNPTNRTVPYHVLEPLTANNTDYRWKVRTCYNAAGTDCSAYSPVWSFSTNSLPTAWWKFDQTPIVNGTTLLDVGISGQNGTFVGNGTWGHTDTGDGILDTALFLNGLEEYVDLGTPAFVDWNASEGTLSGRVKILVVGGGIFSNSDGDAWVNERLTLFFRNLSNTWGWSFADGTTSQNDSFSPLPQNEWATFTVAWNGTTVWTYLNGLLINQQAQTVIPVLFSNPGTSWLGRTQGISPDNLANYLDGSIDEVAIFRYALSSEAIINNFCATEALAGISPLPEVCQ
ncbi:MAG: LamG domain-containing protein [Deltaproteobacteria bacterium]|nr:LamG domain-containing protein [Deltaproteobacteria bacterium]